MQIFVDNQLNADYSVKGFVIVRLFDEDEARRLLAECEACLPNALPAHENVSFIYDGEPELTWLDRIVAPVIDSKLMPLLHRMRRYHPAVIVKPAGEKLVPPHVHPIFTLEQAYSTLFCWCPLQDTDETNGAMQVLAGSHKLFPSMPMYGEEPYFLPAFHQIVDRMTTLHLKAGEALLFDESLIHGSLPNPSHRNRLAIAAHCIHEDLQPITLFRAGNGQYRVCATGSDFAYQHHSRQDEVDAGERWRTLGYVDDPNRKVGPEEFFVRLEEGERISLTYPLVERRDAAPPRAVGWLNRLRQPFRAVESSIG